MKTNWKTTLLGVFTILAAVADAGKRRWPPAPESRWCATYAVDGRRLRPTPAGAISGRWRGPGHTAGPGL